MLTIPTLKDALREAVNFAVRDRDWNCAIDLLGVLKKHYAHSGTKIDEAFAMRTEASIVEGMREDRLKHELDDDREAWNFARDK